MAISTPLTLGTNSSAVGGSTIILTTSAAVLPGSKIWVFVAWQNGSVVTLSSVAGGSLSWNIDKQSNSVGFSAAAAIVSADAPTGLASSTAITATFSQSVADTIITGAYSTGVRAGVTGYTPAIQTQSSGTTWTSGNVTPPPGDILMGCGHYTAASGSATNTPSGGNSELHDLSTADGESFTTCYQQGSGAAIASSGTWSATMVACMSIGIGYSGSEVPFTPHRLPLGA